MIPNACRTYSCRVLISVLLVAVGCTHPGDESSAQERIPTWSLRSDLRIGSADDPDYSLTYVADLEIGSDGSVFVSQPQDRTIRVFDRRGRFLRTIGRAGEGPGEFRHVSQIGWIGDTLWVSDAVLRRVSFFGRGGNLRRTLRFSLPSSGYYLPSMPLGFTKDGSVLTSPSINSSFLVSGRGIRVPLLRADRTARVLDTIAWRSAASEALVLQQGRVVSNYQPFRDTPIWRVAPSGEYVVVLDRTSARSAQRTGFSMTKIGIRGDTLLSRRYYYTPKPIPQRVADSVVSVAANDVAASFPSRSRAVEAVRAAMYLPRYQPPVSDMVVGVDGTIWLMREGIGEAQNTWMILDSSGRILAQLRTPRGLSVLQARSNALWGVEYDELGVPYIVRYWIDTGSGRR